MFIISIFIKAIIGWRDEETFRVPWMRLNKRFVYPTLSCTNMKCPPTALVATRNNHNILFVNPSLKPTCLLLRTNGLWLPWNSTCQPNPAATKRMQKNWGFLSLHLYTWLRERSRDLEPHQMCARRWCCKVDETLLRIPQVQTWVSPSSELECSAGIPVLSVRHLSDKHVNPVHILVTRHWLKSVFRTHSCKLDEPNKAFFNCCTFYRFYWVLRKKLA